MPLRKEVDPEKTAAAASGVFRDVCSEEPPYHMAEELWEGLKQGDEGNNFVLMPLETCHFPTFSFVFDHATSAA